MGRNRIFGELAKVTTMRLYDWEKPDIKRYIKENRLKKIEELKQQKQAVKEN